MLNRPDEINRTGRQSWAILLLCATLIAVIDQASKAAVADKLVIGQSWTPIPALASIFEITRSVNSGAAFGLFQGANLMLLLLSLVMGIGIVIYFRRLPTTLPVQIVLLGILLGGVIGNALDRLRLGTVVDFIHWQLPGVISNVSNLADHAIVLSVIGLLIYQWRIGLRPEQAQHTPPKLKE